MRVSRSEVERYRSQMESISADAEKYARSRVLSECAGLAVGDAREQAKSILADTVDVFGMRAQAAACSLFDEIMDAEGVDISPAQTFEGLTDPDDIDRKVRYYARKLVDGDLDGFADDCARRAGFYAWREADICQMENADRS